MEIDTLSFAVDSRPVAKAAEDLDKMAAAGGRAEAEAKLLKAATEGMTTAIGQAVNTLRAEEAQARAAAEALARKAREERQTTQAANEHVAAYRRQQEASDKFLKNLRDEVAMYGKGRAEVEAYKAAMAGLSVEQQRMAANMGRQLDAMKAQQTQLGGMATAARAMGAAMVAGFVVDRVVEFGKAVFQASTEAERLRTTLNFASGGNGLAELAYITRTANQLGLELSSTAKAYAAFQAASRGTAIEGDKARQVFEAVSKASSVMGLSAEQASGALTALQQMVSKGTVQAEELRGQLSERLPGAFQIAARAMGVTTAELGKMLEQGQVLADDFLPKFARQLETELGGAAEKAAERLDAAVNRFDNAWERLKKNVGDSGVSETIAQGMSNGAGSIDAISTAMEQAREKGGGFTRQMLAAAGAIMDLMDVNDRATVNMRDNARATKDAEAELAKLKALGAVPGDGTWHAEEMTRLENYLRELRKAAAERAAFESRHIQANVGDVRIANEANQREKDAKAEADRVARVQEEAAAVLGRLQGVKDGFFKDLNKLYAGFQSGMFKDTKDYAAAVEKLIKEKGVATEKGTRGAAAAQRDATNAMIEEARRQQQVLEEQSRQSVMRLTEQRREGSITEIQYIKAVATEEQKRLTLVETSLQRQLTVAKTKKNNDTQVEALEGQIALNREKRITRQIQLENDLAAAERQRRAESDRRRADDLTRSQDELTQLEESNRRQAEENELIGKSAEQVRVLTVARMNATIARKQDKIAAMQGISQSDEDRAAIDLEIQKLNELTKARDLYNQGAIATVNDQLAKKQQGEYDQWAGNFSNGVADALVTAITEGGKEGGKALRKQLQESLIKEPLKVFFKGAVDGLMNFFGIGGSGGAGGAMGAMGGGAGNNMLGMLSNLFGLGNTASTAYSAYSSGSGMLGGLMSRFGLVSPASAAATTAAQSAISSNIAMAPGTAPALPAGTLQAAGVSNTTMTTASRMFAGFMRALPIIGAILMGMQGSARAYDQGYRLEDSTIRKSYGLIFPQMNKLTSFFTKLTGNERTANIITGGALIAKFASRVGLQATLHSGAGAISKLGVTQEGREIYNQENFKMGDVREYNEKAQEMVTAVAENISGTLDLFFENFGIAAGVKVGTAFADDISKDGAWGALRIENSAGKKLVDWQDTRTSRWAPKEFGDGEAGYKQYMNELSRSTIDALKASASELPAWANRIIAAADTSGDEVEKVMDQLLKDVADYPDALLQSVGTSRDELVSMFAEGLKTGDAKEAGETVANTLVAAVEDTLFTQGAGRIFDIINMGIVTPMVDALLTGATISDVMSEATMKAVIDRATVTAKALNDLFNDPAFAALLNELKTGLSTALSGVGSALTYKPQFALKEAEAAADDLEEAATDASDAADEAKQKWQQITDALLDDKYQLEIDLLRAMGEEEKALAMERTRAIEGMDAYQIGLYDANEATRARIKSINDEKVAIKKALDDAANHIVDFTDRLTGYATDNSDRAMARVEKAIEAERARLEKQYEDASTTVDTLRSIFDLIEDSVRDLWGEVEDTVAGNAVAARSYLANAIMVARTTGVMPDEKELRVAIEDARAGLDQQVYASTVEGDYQRLVLAGELNELKSLGQEELTEAEQLLENSDKALEGLDEQLRIAQEALEKTRGTFENTLSISEAMTKLLEILGVEKNTRDAIAANYVVGKDGAVYDRGSDIGRNDEGVYFNGSTILDAATKHLEAGGSAWAVYDAISGSGYSLRDAEVILGQAPGSLVGYAEKMGWPVFHDGTNYVPRTGFALLQEGEAVVPRDYNPAYTGTMSNGNDASILVRLLEVAEQTRALLQRISDTTDTTQDMLNDVTEGGNAMRIIIMEDNT